MNKEIKTIQSVQRTLDIINCVAESGGRISLKQISEETGLNINTARGLVQTLLVNGYLSKDPEFGAYFLGYEFYTKWKQLYDAQIHQIRDASYPAMTRISNLYRVTTCLQISFHNSMYTTETVAPADSPYAYVPNSGVNLPTHASASGKVLIAYTLEEKQKDLIENGNYEPLTEHTITDKNAIYKMIKQVQDRGYATELDEISVGVSSIAAPFFDFRGNLAGTLSIVGASAVIQPKISKMTRELTMSCDQITNKLSFRKQNKRP